jgi:hypothetical protein
LSPGFTLGKHQLKGALKVAPECNRATERVFSYSCSPFCRPFIRERGKQHSLG